jgi:hypothetical protein
LGGAIGGAVLGGFLWFMLNNMLSVNDVGWLAAKDDWWARWHAWSAIGAGLAVASEAGAGWKARRRYEEMQRASEFLGFQYVGTITRDRLARRRTSPRHRPQ